MNGYDFAGWVSQLCALNNSGSDKMFVEYLTSFAAECGVEVSHKDIAEWFRLDDAASLKAAREE